MSATAPSRGAAETVPIEHETFDRVVRTLVFGVPPVALAVAGWLAWGGTLHWHDLVVLAITYTLTGLGVTVGYHRLFTHRSFKTGRAVRALLAVLGSMAVEGPVIEWVATHRKHHRFSDQQRRPAQPARRPGAGLARHAARPGPCPRRLDVPRQGHGQPGAATPRTCSPTATCASSAAPSPCGSRSAWPSRSAWASP